MATLEVTRTTSASADPNLIPAGFKPKRGMAGVRRARRGEPPLPPRVDAKLELNTVATTVQKLPKVVAEVAKETVEAKAPEAEKSVTDTPGGPLRPHLGIKVAPNHGLYAFFRRKPASGAGDANYETVEENNPATQKSGELRSRGFALSPTLIQLVNLGRPLMECC
jgi:hypothetical protein